jgi:fluoroacetyl-CoA thioesterase
MVAQRDACHEIPRNRVRRGRYPAVVTTMRFSVTDLDTAIALGSGDVPVLATPRMVAWFEAATVAAAAPLLDHAGTSVGIEVWAEHRRASPVGAVVEVEVLEVLEVDRGISFGLVARELPAAGADAGPREIGRGRVVRAVVDRAAFLDRLEGRRARPSTDRPG